MTDALKIAFECNIVMQGDRLGVAYRITNQCGSSIGILNGLSTIGLDDTLQFSPNHVYVEFKEGKLELKKCILSMPDDVKAAEQPIPYVTLLKDGGEFTETFFVPVPIQVCQPMIRATLVAPDMDVAATDVKQASIVSLTIGIVQATSDLKFIPVSPAYPGLFRIWPPPDGRQILLSRDTRLESPIAVMDYKQIPMKSP
jgi:hypothetical protein